MTDNAEIQALLDQEAGPLHFHSMCFSCLSPKEIKLYRETNGIMQMPGGYAYESKDKAITDALYENAKPYMAGFGGHHQEVVSCRNKHCFLEDRPL